MPQNNNNNNNGEQVFLGITTIVFSMVYIPVLLSMWVDYYAVLKLVDYFDTVDEFDSESFDRLAGWKLAWIIVTTVVAALQFLSGCVRIFC
jgi:hypothetical protein